MKNFVILGVAGYIAIRHLKAIKETGNNLLAAIDPSDSVGRLDSYFPEADYFRSFDDFLKNAKLSSGVDFVSICTPNN